MVAVNGTRGKWDTDDDEDEVSDGEVDHTEVDHSDEDHTEVGHSEGEIKENDAKRGSVGVVTRSATARPTMRTLVVLRVLWRSATAITSRFPTSPTTVMPRRHDVMTLSLCDAMTTGPPTWRDDDRLRWHLTAVLYDAVTTSPTTVTNPKTIGTTTRTVASNASSSASAPVVVLGRSSSIPDVVVIVQSFTITPNRQLPAQRCELVAYITTDSAAATCRQTRVHLQNRCWCKKHASKSRYT